MDAFGNIDSKYRFIILAAKRAKQLLKGAKPKIETRSKNPIRIAQAEVRNGLVEYEIIPTRMDDVPEREDRIFVGGGVPEEAVESDGLAGKDVADEATDLGGEEETPEAGEESEDENEDVEGEEDLGKEDKEE
ncbi:MAG: DNA-directed RNA polymerase subunit omega [Acidobacteriota bacterium]